MKSRLSTSARSITRPLAGFDARGLVLPVAVLCLAEILALAYLPPDSYSFAAPHNIAAAMVRLVFDGTLLDGDAANP